MLNVEMIRVNMKRFVYFILEKFEGERENDVI